MGAALLFLAIAAILGIKIIFKYLQQLQPVALPVLGHLYMLGKLPHHSMMAVARQYGPLIKLRLGSVPVLLVSSPDMAKEFLKTNDLCFASRPSLLTSKLILYNSKDMVFAPYGDHWRNLRKLCVLELLTEKRIASFAEVRRQEVLKMLQGIIQQQADEPFVVLDHLTKFAFNVITRMLMNKVYFDAVVGDTGDEAREFIKLQDEGTILLGEFHIGDYIPWLACLDPSVARMKNLHKAQDRFLQKVVDEHRLQQQQQPQQSQQRQQPDFVDIMLGLPFPSIKEQDTVIKALVQNLLGAATDTSITVVHWALTELLNHPRTLSKAQEELDAVIGRDNLVVQENDLHRLTYLNAVVKETFRLHPPAPLLIPHEAIRECKVDAGRVHVAAGTRVFVNVYAIGRDPALWTQANDFVPERFMGSTIDVQGRDFELLPFGAGRRGCPGVSLGLLAFQLTLANLLHAFDWRLPPKVASHPTAECFGVVTTMETPLRAIAKPRLLPRAYKVMS